MVQSGRRVWGVCKWYKVVVGCGGVCKWYKVAIGCRGFVGGTKWP